MEIYQNKKSGKDFIYIDDSDTVDEALFISPECKVIILKFDLFFDEPKEGDEEGFLSSGLITKAQMDKYRQYVEDRLEESSDWIEDNAPAPSRPAPSRRAPSRPAPLRPVKPVEREPEAADEDENDKQPDMMERLSRQLKPKKW